jgi:predicted Zn-ribbon and HTH transcriptional regulator
MSLIFWAAFSFIVFMIPVYLAKKYTPSVPDNLLIARCPNCKSTSITANKQGFGIGKAAVGALAVGPLGVLAGGLGANKIKLTCLSCGNQWDNNGFSATQDRQLQKQEILAQQTPKPQRYIKKSTYEKITAKMVAGQTNPEVIVSMLEASRENLVTENIKVVSDEEFTRITGKP